MNSKLFFPNKTLYQTYECTYRKLHPKYQETTSRWKDMCHDWKYSYFTANQRRDYMISTLDLSDEAIKAYDKTKSITQSDMWRFVITGKNGGMWADLDSVPITNIDNLFIDNPDLDCDLVTTPGHHRTGTNCANFIFAKDSYLGNELANIVHESLEMSGFMIRQGDPILHFDTIGSIWNGFIKIHQDRIQQILTNDYVAHSDMWKPPASWREKYESKLPKNHDSMRTKSPGIYTEEWKSLYDKAKQDLLTLCYNESMTEITNPEVINDKCCAACTCEDPHRSKPIED